MPWQQTDPVDFSNLNTKSGLVFDVRDRDFGAISRQESHAAIQSAINHAASVSGRVRITQGTYLIKRPLLVPSNCTIEWDSGSFIKASPSFEPGSEGNPGGAMLLLLRSENVTLINPQLDGDKVNNKQIEFAGLRGVGAKSIQVIGGTIRNMPARIGPPPEIRIGSGDAIYLTDDDDSAEGAGPCEFWRIFGTEVLNCVRNGIALISAKNCIVDGVIASGNGYGGIDVEPNTLKQRAFGLNIRNCILTSNGCFGISLGGLASGGKGATALMGNMIEFNKDAAVRPGDQAGIHINNFDDVQVVGNIVRHNGLPDPQGGTNAVGVGISIANSLNISFVANTVLQQSLPYRNANQSQACCNIGF